MQRENAIVNRLNKTKVEKHPNLKQEKDDRLRELRKREQAAQQERVRPLRSTTCRLLFSISYVVFTKSFLPCVEKRRGQDCQGTQGEKVSKGAQVRRPLYRGQHGDAEQPKPRRVLGGRLYVAVNLPRFTSGQFLYFQVQSSVQQRI